MTAWEHLDDAESYARIMREHMLRLKAAYAEETDKSSIVRMEAVCDAICKSVTAMVLDIGSYKVFEDDVFEDFEGQKYTKVVKTLIDIFDGHVENAYEHIAMDNVEKLEPLDNCMMAARALRDLVRK